MGIVLGRWVAVARKHHQHCSRYRRDGGGGEPADWWSLLALLRTLRCHLGTFTGFYSLQNILLSPQMADGISLCLCGHRIRHTGILERSSARDLSSRSFLQSRVYGSTDCYFGNDDQSIPILLAVWRGG